MKDAYYLRDFAIDVLKKIKSSFSESTIQPEENEELQKPISFISQMLKISTDNDAFSSEEVINETMTAILAVNIRILLSNVSEMRFYFTIQGTETSATAMSNAILLLAMHPDKQEKAVQELREVFKDQNSEITKEDLNKLVYLEMVVKEGMRLLTVSPVYVRQVTGDVTLCE
jgi:cytochrome P450